jgi:ABC-type phosphate transport system substrate-binding protein
MYHLTLGGKQITNLRLSGDTITKIFTGQITTWSDPQIVRDYGGALPSEPIVPVVRSDGSGATAQFTSWMNDQYESQWSAFCRQNAGISARPCGETEFYPTFGRAKAQNGSTAAANYVTSSAGEGSINYDEYAYAKQSGFPVVKLLNPAGYYVLPTAANDAVALTRAVIDTNPASLTYLMQDLRRVYRNPDPRAYPLSSYSYLIVPRKNRGAVPPQFTDAKGATLSTWATYFLCGGQKEADALGYSPLPVNLVRAGLDQVDQIPGALPTPSRAALGGCDNPTFVHGKNTLLAHAPMPPLCDRKGSPLNGCGASNPARIITGRTPSAAVPGQSNVSEAGRQPGSTAPQSSPSQPGAAAPLLDPANGGPISAADSGVPAAVAQPVELASQHQNNVLFSALTAAELILAATLPPFVGLAWRRRRRS